MFDKAIIDTDDFCDLPASSKALYFLLGMEADDEGFVSPNKVIRMHMLSNDDLKILIAKEYCIQFMSGVIVITHFKMNNWLDSRRIKPTIHQEEVKMLTETETKKYQLIEPSLAIAKPTLSQRSREEWRTEENSIDIYVPKIKNIFDVYKNKIHKKSKLTPKAKQKIKKRLQECTEEELIQAIENFSNHNWWMKNNSKRGLAWFFHSEDRIQQFIHLEPEDKGYIDLDDL